jgi:hypothetical protein
MLVLMTPPRYFTYSRESRQLNFMFSTQDMANPYLRDDFAGTVEPFPPSSSRWRMKILN